MDNDRTNFTIRANSDLLKRVKSEAKRQNLSVANMMENMFRYYLRLEIPTKPTKLGRTRAGSTPRSTKS